MSIFEQALKLDLDKKYYDAILMYEEALKTGETPVDLYINLSFIYFHTAAEFSWAFHYEIPNSVKNICWNRCLEIINEAITIHSENSEVQFWKLYFQHRLIDTELSEEDIEDIVAKYKDGNLVPYFFACLYDREKYKTQTDILVEQCKALPTAKNIYILSFFSNPT